MIAVPAAVALVSIIWFLRRKASSKGDKRSPKKSNDPNIASTKLSNSDQNHKPEETKVPAHPLLRENQGITLTQRKIPKTPSKQELEDVSFEQDNVCSNETAHKESTSSLSNLEDALTQREKETVHDLVQSVIGSGIAEAKVALAECGDEDDSNKKASSYTKKPEVREEIVEEMMISTQATPSQHAVPKSSHISLQSLSADQTLPSPSKTFGNSELDMSSLSSKSSPSPSSLSSQRAAQEKQQSVSIASASPSCDDLGYSGDGPKSQGTNDIQESVVSCNTANKNDTVPYPKSQSSSSATNISNNMAANSSLSVNVTGCVSDSSITGMPDKNWVEQMTSQKTLASSPCHEQSEDSSTNSVSPGCDNNSVVRF